MSQIAVRCVGVAKAFGQTLAVQGVDLGLEKGSTLALLGPSGCGKTTLMRLIAGFEVPDRGLIEVGERVVADPGTWVPPEKRRVGIVFQDYALFPHLDVAANIAFGLPRGADRQGQVREMLSLVGLKGYEDRMPHQLSGGQQQRVALARALAPEPEVILLDEPFSNLDADLRTRVRSEVRGILACAEATAIFVTHDQEEALYMGSQVGVMNGGRLEQVDTPEGIFHSPATLFVAQFVGIGDILDGEVGGRTVETDLGHLPLVEALPGGTAVKVVVRPDALDIQPAAAGMGVIVDRVFQGMHYVYRLRLPSGATVRSLQHYTHSYPLGTRVEVTLNPGRSLACFVDGRIVARVSTDVLAAVS